MRRALPWLLLCAACGAEHDAVLVTVVDVPPETTALEATFRLDGVDAMEPARFDPPTGGFGSTTSFVALLPDGSSGEFEVTVVAEGDPGCTEALGSAAATLPASEVQVTLAHALPGAPELFWPPNGFDTGSHLAPDTLRPRIRWTAQPGASTYQVQLDDSCDAPFADCDFPSPELDELTTDTDYRPAADLAISTVAPVGRRYALRVRTCDCAECGDWSPVRYVDVGRQRADTNGDGYADMVIGSSGVDVAVGQEDAGIAYLYTGNASGWPMSHNLTVNGGYKSGYLGGSAAWVGDLNGDGRGDLAIGEYNAPNPVPSVPGAGRALLFLAITDVVGPTFLYSPLPMTGSQFSLRLDGCDLDGDGYAELVIAADSESDSEEEVGSGHVYIYRGTADLPQSPRTLDNPLAAQMAGLFGADLDCGGDLDGDGYYDLAIGAPGQNGNQGAVYVYRGGPAGVADVPDYTLAPPDNQAAPVYFGTGLAIGDLDGDGFADLVVGAESWDADAVDEGSAFYYPGGRAGPAAVATGTFDCPDGVVTAAFGDDMTIARDLDGDGISDLVVGAIGWTTGGARGGAFVFTGAADGPAATARYTLASPLGDVGAAHGFAVGAPGDADGDGDTELLVSEPFLDNVAVNRGRVWLYAGAPEFSDTTLTYWDGANQAGVWFGSALTR